MERKLKKFFLRKFSQISSGRWKDRLFFNPRSDYHLLMIDCPGDYKRERMQLYLLTGVGLELGTTGVSAQVFHHEAACQIVVDFDLTQ